MNQVRYTSVDFLYPSFYHLVRRSTKKVQMLSFFNLNSYSIIYINRSIYDPSILTHNETTISFFSQLDQALEHKDPNLLLDKYSAIRMLQFYQNGQCFIRKNPSFTLTLLKFFQEARAVGAHLTFAQLLLSEGSNGGSLSHSIEKISIETLAQLPIEELSQSLDGIIQKIAEKKDQPKSLMQRCQHPTVESLRNYVQENDLLLEYIYNKEDLVNGMSANLQQITAETLLEWLPQKKFAYSIFFHKQAYQEIHNHGKFRHYIIERAKQEKAFYSYMIQEVLEDGDEAVNFTKNFLDPNLSIHVVADLYNLVRNPKTPAIISNYLRPYILSRLADLLQTYPTINPSQQNKIHTTIFTLLGKESVFLAEEAFKRIHDRINKHIDPKEQGPILERADAFMREIKKEYNRPLLDSICPIITLVRSREIDWLGQYKASKFRWRFWLRKVFLENSSPLVHQTCRFMLQALCPLHEKFSDIACGDMALYEKIAELSKQMQNGLCGNNLQAIVMGGTISTKAHEDWRDFVALLACQG